MQLPKDRNNWTGWHAEAAVEAAWKKFDKYERPCKNCTITHKASLPKITRRSQFCCIKKTYAEPSYP